MKTYKRCVFILLFLVGLASPMSMRADNGCSGDTCVWNVSCGACGTDAACWQETIDCYCDTHFGAGNWTGTSDNDGQGNCGGGCSRKIVM